MAEVGLFNTSFCWPHNGNDHRPLTQQTSVKQAMPTFTVEQMLTAIKFINVVAIPCISFLGIIGNSISIIVISKTRLKKSSDILLFGLAVADVTFLLGVNNIPLLLLTVVGNFEFAYSYRTSLFLYHALNTIHWVGHTALLSSYWLPVLITMERLVAIFFPLKFPLIMTRRRVLAMVCAVYLLSGTVFAYLVLTVRFEYTVNSYNVSVGIVRSSNIYPQPVRTLINHMSGTVPVVLVILGTAIIGVKIKMASMVRKKLSSRAAKDATNSRITRILVSVCVVYSIIMTFISLSDQFNQYYPGNLGTVMRALNTPLSCINSSCNYIIYVANNSKFKISALCKHRQEQQTK